ncbi:1377_t:CDS:2, partial [Diversispora eburnea]
MLNKKYQQHLNRKNPCRPKNFTQAPIGNPATALVLVQNITPTQNPVPAPEDDHISKRKWYGVKEDFCALSNKYYFIKTDLKETVIEAYKRFIKESETIVEKTKGQVDMRKSGCYTLTSLKLFREITLAPKRSEKVDEKENAWLNLATTGALVFAERYKGEAIHDMFRKWDNILYNIKKKGGIVEKVSKALLVSLWGALCEQRNGQNYRTHSRIKLFLLASVRKRISEIMRPLVAGQVNLKTDIEMGELKLEKREVCTIKNCISITWKSLYLEILNLITNSLPDFRKKQQDKEKNTEITITRKSLK